MTTDLVEPFGVPDTFVSGLAEVEDIGSGVMRFVFYSLHDGERQVVAKLIAPVEAVPPAVMLAARSVGWCLVRNQTCPALVN